VNGGEKLDNRLAVQVAALVAVIGFVCFAGGYVVAGGVQKQTDQYLIGENIVVNVKAPGENTYRAVKLSSGMTALDAVAYVMPIKTDLTWVEMYGPAIETADNQWFEYKINGVLPSVGLVAYQLRGGENIELTLA
jgi:hypothetical protein